MLPVSLYWISKSRRALGERYPLLGTNGAPSGLDVARFLGGRRCRGTRQPAPDPRPQCVAGGHRRTEDLLGGKAARLFGSDRWRQRPRGQGVCRAGSACGAASTMARRNLRSGRVAARYHPLASERGNAGDVVQMVTPFVSGLTNQPQGGPLFSRETHDCPSPFGCAVATDFLHATANCCIEFV
jgi:hypothetical protein